MPATFHSRSRGFTLVELLVVMAIIGILAGLTLFAASQAINQAARKRAQVEIQAMSSALENYKTDNGTYPPDYTLNQVNGAYATVNPTIGTYQTASHTLYLALSGADGTSLAQTPTPGAKTYMSFKANQIAIYAQQTVYIQDPFHNSYGYSTGTTGNPPIMGAGFFDLWSTGGKTGTDPVNDPRAWITNWK